ncbi:hypothetical protein [Desulfobacula sp.]|uniref:hypothetical protein n=1 Tax=Desulfobacula sp. TaxID=2593537 RepID=UPI0026127FB7|nr:hypothetical protein [Desulfobacula sp.]
MLMRSTGLGRTELEGHVTGITVKGDYVIIAMKTTEPVKWQVRIAADLPDLLSMARLLVFSLKGIKFFIVQFFKSLLLPFKKNKGRVKPEDF